MASKQKRSTTTAKKKTAAKPNLVHSELVEVRNSPIHGRGVYAVQPIKKGTRVYEYVGERISHAEADRRFWKKQQDDGHTFLFVVNRKTVIDGTRLGNDARYINHRCDANCETVTEDNRIFIEATADIKKGEELGYDYQLTWSSEDTPEDLALYNCRCGSKNCRGTMLDKQSIEDHLAEDRAKRKRAKARAKAAGKVGGKAATKSTKKKAAKKKSAAKKGGKRSKK
ncbi:MAG: SET domain-containing protein-lysine N-methyltransferase [Steroidobacteraceae bacterium]